MSPIFTLICTNKTSRMAVQTLNPFHNPTLPVLPAPSPPHSRRLPRRHHSATSLPNLFSSSNERRPLPDVVSWTTAIARYSRGGRLSLAADAFGGMLSAGVVPNHVTFVALLSACADFPSSPSSLALGRAIHAHSLKRRRPDDAPEELVVLSTALVDMYAKCGSAGIAGEVFDRMPVKNSVSFNTMIAGCMRNGDLDRALNLFDRMPRRDKVSWTAVIDGCVKNSMHELALDYFRAMQLARIDADYVTILALIAACTGLGALSHGLWVHRYVKNHQGFSDNVKLGNALIDMYSRCGCVDFANQMFESMSKRTLVSWNSMIVSFAVNGRCNEAIQHFEMMQREGFKPDGVSFTGLLTACSHAGLVDEGLKFYDLMKEEELPERVEHYGCLVDLLSRAGRLEEAMSVVERMPFQPNEVILSSLLAACKVHGNIELAERVTAYLQKLELECDSNYILMSNLYAAVGWWDGVSEVRNMMKAIGLKKTPGFSSIETNCDIHVFVAGDRSHPHSDDIYLLLSHLHCELELRGCDSKVILGVNDD